MLNRRYVLRFGFYMPPKKSSNIILERLVFSIQSPLYAKICDSEVTVACLKDVVAGKSFAQVLDWPFGVGRPQFTLGISNLHTEVRQKLLG